MGPAFFWGIPFNSQLIKKQPKTHFEMSSQNATASRFWVSLSSKTEYFESTFVLPLLTCKRQTRSHGYTEEQTFGILSFTFTFTNVSYTQKKSHARYICCKQYIMYSLHYTQGYQIDMIDDIDIPVQMWNETVSLFGERILRMWRMSGMPEKETSSRKETGQKRTST